MQFYAFTGWGAHEPAAAQRKDESSCSEERKTEEIVLLLGLPVHNCVSILRCSLK